jgi:hypothetical protein
MSHDTSIDPRLPPLELLLNYYHIVFCIVIGIIIL